MRGVWPRQSRIVPDVSSVRGMWGALATKEAAALAQLVPAPG